MGQRFSRFCTRSDGTRLWPLSHLQNLTPSQSACRAVVAIVVCAHVGALAWSAGRHSPTMDEPAHLAAGMSHWHLGRFDLYKVNPPLVRMVAALPVLAARPAVEWRRQSDSPEARPAVGIGRSFLMLNGQRSFFLFAMARWACIPFSVLGAWVCWRWAGELYGRAAGVLAATLWCASPNVIAHAQAITPDAAAAAMGAAAAYTFWRWLRRPTWSRAAAAGTVLGLAELTKTTWIVLFALWPLLWIAWRWPLWREPWRRRWGGQAAQLGTILILGLYLINFGYGFEGSFKPLGDYKFVSRTLGGYEDSTGPRGDGRNRFAGTAVAAVPVPLPENYVLGIDLQKWDFERGRFSYLRGQWRAGGWWYYYIYALAIKVPLGTWLLMLLACLVGLLRWGYAASWRDELVLLAPIIVVLTLVSSQTGFNHHLRYVLPIFPLAFVWASKVARAVDLKHRKMALLAGAALLWSAGSSLWVYPHSLSYFNELVGGPTGGHAHLGGSYADSNIDSGQDLLYLKRWLDKHPQARPLHLAVISSCPPSIAGIQSTLPPPQPQPGWYALSVKRIRSRTGEYACFLRFEPLAMAGYSIYIYHVTPDEANRVRRELGMDRLPPETPLHKPPPEG